MRKQKSIQALIILILVAILACLNIPKYNQVAPLIMESLVLAGFDNFNIQPTTILGVLILLELITSLINIAILHWIYKMSQLNYALGTNSILYLLSSCLSKAISLVIPLSVLATVTILPNLIFGLIFLLLHFYTNRNINRKQQSWVGGFVLINILVSFL